MKFISGKAFAKILERRGWRLLQIQGSHHIYCRPNNPIHLSIPVYGNKDLKVGLLKYFLKQAGLSEEDL